MTSAVADYLIGGLAGVVLLLLGALGWVFVAWWTDAKAWRQQVNADLVAIKTDADTTRGVLGEVAQDTAASGANWDDFERWCAGNLTAKRPFIVKRRARLEHIAALVRTPTLTRPAPASALRGVREGEET